MELTKDVMFADRYFKLFDELVVNVIDAATTMRGKYIGAKYKAYQITECNIQFRKDGTIIVANNGMGLPIDYVKDAVGKPILVPELVSTQFLAGSNNNDDAGRITGGVNGIGLTMVNVDSEEFIFETVDLERSKHFTQASHNRMTVVDQSYVSPVNVLPKNHLLYKGGTCITYKPSEEAYEFIKYSDQSWARRWKVLDQVFKARALQVAACGLKVSYNGEVLPVKCLFDYAKLFMTDESHVISLTINPSEPVEPNQTPTPIPAQTQTSKPKPKHAWQVCLALTPESIKKQYAFTFVNGVHVIGGSHVTHLRTQTASVFESDCIKLIGKYVGKYDKKYILDNVMVFMCGNIPNPQFGSQMKDKLSDPIAKFANYKIQKKGAMKKQLDTFWGVLSERLTQRYIEKTAASKSKHSTAKIDKYLKAKYAGDPKKSNECRLFICEGDSAAAMVRNAIKSGKVGMSFDYCGIFNIGGVPLNTRKHSKQVRGGFSCEKKMMENERWKSLSAALRCSHPMRVGEKIAYGTIVLMTDQDDHGIGQITGLCISHFERFRPDLMDEGRIAYLGSPIIRAFPRGSGAVLSFYSNAEYHTWLSGVDVSKFVIEYYKGLATHNDEEAIEIMKQYNTRLCLIRRDPGAHATCETYYGLNVAPRKIELSHENRADKGNAGRSQAFSQETSCTQHLKTYVYDFQQMNNRSKLPDIIDGLNPARRKVVCATRTMKGIAKVFVVASHVAKPMKYHHGSTSLEGTIVNMAQQFVGARNLPQMLPLSQFGTRWDGPSVHGETRYIKTKTNTALVNALYPSEDNAVLQYIYDEGEKCEPCYYVPVAPTALLESLSVPANAWKYEGYARDWNSVRDRVFAMINNLEQTGHVPEYKECRANDDDELPFWSRGWTGAIRNIPNRRIVNLNEWHGNDDALKPAWNEHITWDSKGLRTFDIDEWWFIGTYVRDTVPGDVVRVIELPFGVWVEPWKESIEELDLVEKVDDYSKGESLNLCVKFQPGAIDLIYADKKYRKAGRDPLEVYLKLTKKIQKELNFTQWIDGGSRTRICRTYMEVLYIWFKERYDTYVKRMCRREVLLKIMIKHLEEIIRYVDSGNKYEFGRMTEEEGIEVLRCDKYWMFSSSGLRDSSDIPTDELNARLMAPPADVAAMPKQGAPDYNYLFRINARDRFEKARSNREAQLNLLREELSALESNKHGIVCETWRRELGVLDELITEAVNHPKFWLCREKQVKYS